MRVLVISLFNKFIENKPPFPETEMWKVPMGISPCFPTPGAVHLKPEGQHGNWGFSPRLLRLYEGDRLKLDGISLGLTKSGAIIFDIPYICGKLHSSFSRRWTKNSECYKMKASSPSSLMRLWGKSSHPLCWVEWYGPWAWALRELGNLAVYKQRWKRHRQSVSWLNNQATWSQFLGKWGFSLAGARAG